ncbi:MAG: thioredoxin domain-containing protein [Candidatus Kryptoniota bacterium]
MEFKNKLGESDSPYLLEAANHPVKWQIFSDDAFKLAEQMNRPILLDIGAAWCHWCHVMDLECYTDPEVASIINDMFIPIKVDRDQMPDVDARYQAAVAALTGTGGWPLTAFLTPGGKVFYGGTYFPKEDRYGRPGLKTVLSRVAEVFRTRTDDVIRSAEEIYISIRNYELQTIEEGELSGDIIDEVLRDAVERFDAESGGFGTAPKFFNATALELLAEEAMTRGDDKLTEMVNITLSSMAAGGVMDQLAGGFHRYSVDRHWHVPHFEKLLQDNAMLIRAYLRGYELTGNDLFARVADYTGKWIISNLKSPEGAFYAHQDSDVEAGDDGSYWTWTLEEVRKVLNNDESDLIERYFGIRPDAKDTPELPGRNVLRVAEGADRIARSAELDIEEVLKKIETAKQKLLHARLQRKAPFIDRTLFTDRNALAISALIDAAAVLHNQQFFNAAEEATRFLIDKMIKPDGGVLHSLGTSGLTYGGLLDDYAFCGIALMDMFDLSREHDYLMFAERIADRLLTDFHSEGGAFVDRPKKSGGAGLLSKGRISIEDAPTPSGNAVAALFLDRLYVTNDNARYFEAAENTLKVFSIAARKMGIFAATYARAVRNHLKI